MGARRRNHDTSVGWDYHEATKHSFQSVRNNAHFLDFANKPLPFKIYTTLEPIELPREVPPLEMPALKAISKQVADPNGESIPDLKAIAQILYYSAGITRIKNYPGGEILFRAASCTGALYEIDLYLVCGDLNGQSGNSNGNLEAGVYHFSPNDFSLRRLREGDYRGVILRATAGDSIVANAPLTIICTATYWRNSWKYQARTYRHFGWDNGTILANLLATTTALKIPAHISMGFIDEDVNRLLSLDINREVAFSMVSLGKTSAPGPDPPLEISNLVLNTAPLSHHEVDYPMMREMHMASSLIDEDEVRRWRCHLPERKSGQPKGISIQLKPFSDEEMSREGLGTVILKRGSTRRFDRESGISFEQFSTLLYRSMQEIPADFLDHSTPHLNSVFLIVHKVDGLQSGAYLLDQENWSIDLIQAGVFRREAGYLGLEQALPAEAAATIFFVADLNAIFERFGNRGYRAAQLESGIIGGKMYLAAYAQGFGASGLTFYDNDVIEFFSPYAENASAIFHLAIGKSAKRRIDVIGG